MDVFRLHSGWVAWHASDAELQQVVEGMFGGPAECHLTPEQIAQGVGAYVKAMRGYFPEVVVGDTITAELDVDLIAEWVEAYRSVTGEDLGFMHLDIPFGVPGWPEKAKAIEDYLRSQGIDFGIFYLGDWHAFSDEDWLSQAGERVKSYELLAGGQPDHILFTTWHDHPDRLLPEDEPYTFTWFINAYFADMSALGYRSEGAGANAAFGKPVRASKSAQAPASGAVDGNLGTIWGAGDFAPQWIEVISGE